MLHVPAATPLFNAPKSKPKIIVLPHDYERSAEVSMPALFVIWSDDQVNKS